MQTKVLIFLAGIIVGGIIGLAVTAKASTGDPVLQIVEEQSLPHLVNLMKVYDSHNGVVCYVAESSAWNNGANSVSVYCK